MIVSANHCYLKRKKMGTQSSSRSSHLKSLFPSLTTSVKIVNWIKIGSVVCIEVAWVTLDSLLT
ncbi:hypothetical protein C5167_005819 [Papaver somniferum]|uniref:Uncharacterized protein n=1 Tax=Papaver somniferum TaxID=3469 RepID=A0A4Y7JBI0_PAPSO|nr:hypothetical protein C5167_005819 [Papaver somniferum]